MHLRERAFVRASAIERRENILREKTVDGAPSFDLEDKTG